jgi:AraC-like DNA-binding protein
MAEFASAAMYRVLLSGMQRMGITPPSLRVHQSATVPLDAKRMLLLEVQRQLGIEALLQLGQGVHDQVSDSLFPILIHPGKPFAVLEAWLRLERYIHSKHRIQQIVLGPNSVKHEHLSTSKDSQPSAQEDLVVIGVLIALLQQSQCIGIEVNLGNGLAVWPIDSRRRDKLQLAAAAQQGSTQRWTIRWDLQADELEKVSSSKNSALALTSPEKAIADRQSSKNFSSTVRAILDQENGATTSIDGLAKALQTSPRTLQRRLAEEGARFADIMGTYRAERASRLLAYSSESLAQIGFAVGYSDQAHFSRDFLRRVGLRPQQYRDHLSL